MQVLGADVHASHRQGIRNARPLPPAGRQVAAKPPIDVAAWIVWDRDSLELLGMGRARPGAWHPARRAGTYCRQNTAPATAESASSEPPQLNPWRATP